MNTICSRAGWLILGTLLSSCVTINIYFPAAAAEQAADKIIGDVWQLKKQGEKGKIKDSEKDQDTDQPLVPRPGTPSQ
jgi:hypothetical protein